MKINRLLSFLPIVFLFVIGLPFASWIDSTNRPIQKPPVFVQPAPDIEFLWGIEDTRSESAVPLVTYLENNGSALGYDAENNTFYCTLGMNTGSEWPDISLCAPEADGVSICFSDDYSYDWCNQAIEEGYAYELMAYTDTEYAYFSLVFTGLPIVTLHTEEEIGTEYVPAYTRISSADHAPVSSLSKAHIRGAIYKADHPKKSYRIEFHRINQNGKDKKQKISALGMPEDSDWLLIANAADNTQLRNHLAWDMWRQWNPDGNAFSLLQSRMVEVFVNNEYMGLYQLMQRIDTDQEIVRMGGNLLTDCAFRILAPTNTKDRLVKDYKATADVHIELRKAPQQYTDEGAFGILDRYIELADVKQGLLDNQAFIDSIQKHMDVKSLISYYLFSQAISLWEDNVYNNLYIWAIQNGKDYSYYFAPWDMDRSFFLKHSQSSLPLLEGQDDVCIDLRVPVRLLNLDGADSRRILWELWNEKRASILDNETLYQWFADAQHLVNGSGAYMRNAEKWLDQAEQLDITELYDYAVQHLGTLERFMRECWPYGEHTPENM